MSWLAVLSLGFMYAVSRCGRSVPSAAGLERVTSTAAESVGPDVFHWPPLVENALEQANDVRVGFANETVPHTGRSDVIASRELGRTQGGNNKNVIALGPSPRLRTAKSGRHADGG